MTAAATERYREEQRRQEQTRAAQLQKLQQERLLRANTLSDERVETKRRMRTAAEIKEEQDLAARLQHVRAWRGRGRAAAERAGAKGAGETAPLSPTAKRP